MGHVPSEMARRCSILIMTPCAAGIDYPTITCVALRAPQIENMAFLSEGHHSTSASPVRIVGNLATSCGAATAQRAN